MELKKLRSKMESVELSGKSDAELIKESVDLVLEHSKKMPISYSKDLIESISHMLADGKQFTKMMRGKIPTADCVKKNRPDPIDPKYNQLIIALEECMEMCIAICEAILYGENEDTLLSLIEEIADVRATLEYVIRIFHLSERDITKVHEIKTERTKYRIATDQLD